jgi:uncharacterized surface protein with fasciclin (FAS1) repeats
VLDERTRWRVTPAAFTTLVAAVKAAKLDSTLSGPGPFTLFAPNDAAFNKLPAGTVDTLLKDPQGQLKDILLYHVVSGKVMAADVVKLTSAKTVEGKNVTITKSDKPPRSYRFQVGDNSEIIVL